MKTRDAGRVEVERVDIEPLVAANHDVQLQHVEGQVLFQAANAIAAVADRNHDFLLLDLGLDVLRRRRLR